VATDDRMTIDELARRAGTTTRNVRVYQERGLLPPPQRQGRLGLYGPEHLIRLQLVLRMLDRGYPLAAIRELVEAWEGQRDLGDVLGLEEAIAAPYVSDAPMRLPRDAFSAVFGEGSVELAAAAGMVEVDGDELVTTIPRFLEVGAELVDDGVPPAAALETALEIMRAVDHIAEVCVGMVDDHIWQTFVDAGMPAAQREEVAAIISRMRTRAETAVVAALARAMQNKVDETFTGTLAQLASRSPRRRAASS
jgi:DNA-binding transcriptional MerR regulator